MSKSVGLLYKAKHYFPSKSLLTVYYALVYPYLTYCNLIWASTYVTNLQRIYLLQKRAVRAISKADYKASSKPLFANLKILGWNLCTKSYMKCITSKFTCSGKIIFVSLHTSSSFSWSGEFRKSWACSTSTTQNIWFQILMTKYVRKQGVT